jgi:tape measure domain-containing protein
MPTLTSDNNIGILIKADADLKAVDDTERSLGRLDSQSESSSKAAGLLGVAGKAAAVGIAAAGAAVLVAGKSAITSAGDYEQSRIAFETMLGSADKARSLMTDIAEFAKSTPFELPEVVSGTKQLLAFGFAQEELLPTMRKLGDLASGLGVPVGQLTNVFGQVKVAGRLMGQDLLQFTNAGVPMIQALADTMKKPQSEIKALVEKGKIGFPQVEVALNSLTKQGSKFGGMMEKQSHSFNGVVSNIKDGFGQMLRAAVGITPAGDIVAGGVFDKIKTAAEAAMPKIAEMIPAVTKAVELLVAALVIIVNVLSDVFKGLQWVYQAMKDGNPIVWALAGVFGTLATAMAFNAIFTALTAGFATLTGTIIPEAIVKVTALRALISTPVLFGAIGIGAALAAFAMIQDAANKAREAIEGAQKAADNATTSNQAVIRKLQDLSKNGTAAQKARAKESLQNLASAGSFATGGFTGKGGVNDVAGVVHKGEYVVPQSQVDQSTGLPKANAVTNNRTVTIGTVVVQGESAGRGFWSDIDQDSLLVGSGLTPQRGF